METVCEHDKCAGCMACVEICPKGAIVIKDALSAYNAIIDKNKCINCNACHSVCPQNNTPKQDAPIKWYQGWANDTNTRRNCSSGGVATSISIAFVKKGDYVYSCCFENGEFRFKRAIKADDVKNFTGSKYVKSNPLGCYKEIRDNLQNGERILFIGLPCQVAAVKNYVGQKYESNLYTIDLICHGTPSPKLLDLFLQQYGRSLSELKDIKFRSKANFMIYGNHKGIVTNGVSDRYTIAFLNSLSYTENCYSCKYACKQRVADLTLGDSWGSELSNDEQKNGVSLILVQTEKGKELLEISENQLLSVDIEKAISNNHQLSHPSKKPDCRKDFFDGLKTKSFNSQVFKCLPYQCLRQTVKQILIDMRVIHNDEWGGVNYSILIK